MRWLHRTPLCTLNFTLLGIPSFLLEDKHDGILLGDARQQLSLADSMSDSHKLHSKKMTQFVLNIRVWGLWGLPWRANDEHVGFDLRLCLF